MRVNSDAEGCSSEALLVVRDDGSCTPGVLAEVEDEEGASYSTSVGRPNAVINAEETIGEAYRFGNGSSSSSSSTVGVLGLLLSGLPNVE